tara:strand:- start:97 stop:705 length:609 start_codon:yes stop_codon:yes gene_type:complete
MDEKYQTALDSIDRVLNEDKYVEWQQADKKAGFTKRKNYWGADALDKAEFSGLDYLVHCSDEGKYLVFEIAIKQGGETIKQTYMRGFEGDYNGHPRVANAIMEELKATFSKYFTLPREWPDGNRNPSSPIKDKKGGAEISIKALGAGNYYFIDNQVQIQHSSLNFSVHAPEYRREFNKLMKILGNNEQVTHHFKGKQIVPIK